MRIGVLGINHKSSELSLRETLARVCLRKFSKQTPIVQELCCVVLSTCNRTEIYFSAEGLAEAHTEILSCLREEVLEPFEHKLYTYFGVDCFFHLAMVTSGLDSVILGESEIQRQVKLAYQMTVLYYSLPSCMHFLFQKCLKIAKQIRSARVVLPKEATLSGMIFQAGQWFIEDFRKQKVLFIGNSEINRRTIAYFKQKKVDSMSLCTRCAMSAEEMAKEWELPVYDWSNLDSWTEYDVVICGTTHSDYVLKAEQVGSETLRTKLVFDLSVPRTVDPLLGKDPRLTLFNVEELGKMIEQRRRNDLSEIGRMKETVWHLVQRQNEIFQTKEGIANSLSRKNSMVFAQV